MLGSERHYLKRIFMADRPLFVVALPLSANTELHAEDAGAVGVYELIADTSMPRGVAAASALESFHTRVAISYPEDFVIKVVDPMLRQVIEPSENDQPLVLPFQKISSVVRGWIANLVDDVEPIAETPGRRKSVVFVVAVPVRPKSELHPYDKSVRGVYSVDITESAMTDAQKAGSALNSFNVTVAVEVPEDFQITVVEGVTNKILEPGADSENREFYCEKLTDGISKDMLDLVGAPLIEKKPESKPAAVQAAAPATKSTLLVVVEEIQGAQVHDDDMGIAGVYEVSGIDPSMTDMERAESALETFHTSNGIADLENYEISVIDPVSRKIMDTGEDCEFAEFDCEKLSGEIPDWIDKLLNPPAAVCNKEDDLSPGF